ncbi:MAG: hypothetical protein ABR517_14370 [Thermoanaerobaculia bacterium]
MNWTFLYLAAVWAAGVFAWRRLATPFSWRVALFFYLLVLVFLFQPLTGDWTSVSVDYLFRLSPWQEMNPNVQPGNSELNDLPLQIVPWAHQVRESWKSFDAPLWNPSAAAGYPLLANGQSAAFSLLRWVTLPLGLADAFTCEAALKILLALAGAFLFLRRRTTEIPALVGAVSFGFSTALLVWLHFPLATVSAWLPAVFLAIDLWIEKRSFGRFILVAVVFSQLLLGGHPETAAHIIFGAGLWLLFRLFAEPRGGRERASLLGGVVGAGVLAFALALPQVLPLLEALPSTKRWDMLEEFPGAHVRSTDARFLVNFIQPAFYGTVREGTAWGPAHAEVVAGYGGILAAAAWPGMLLVVLRRRKWDDESTFLVFAVPLLMGIALHWPFISDAFEAIPLFSLAANARVRLLVVWFLAILAARLVQLAAEGTRWPLAVGGGAMAVALFLAFALSRLDPGTGAWSESLRTTAPAIAVLAVMLLVIAVPARARRVALLALLAVVVADVQSHGSGFNPPVSKSYFYPRTPIISKILELKSLEGTSDPLAWRMTALGGMLFPNTPAIYGLDDIRGHDPMANGKVLGVLRVFTGYTSDSYFGMLRDVSHPVIDFMGVRYVLTSPEDTLPAGQWEEVYSGADGRIFRNLEALPRFFPVRHVLMEFDDEARTRTLLGNPDWANAAVVKRLPSNLMPIAQGDLFGPTKDLAWPASLRLSAAGDDRFLMTVDAPRWTLIASSQPDWPGWRVIRNGTERLRTIRINAAFMGFLVPPGRSEIEVYYAPRSYWVGMWISLSALLVLALAGLLMARRRRRAASNL